MPIKIKIGIALVAVIAIFSVYQITKYVHTLAVNGPTLANISGGITDEQNCAVCDPDHDGLTNAEEVLWNADPFNADTDGDGFKDGEETASGHNPLIPGPDDLISSDNLTDQLSNLTVAGLAAGALNPASASYSQTLADITSSVADSGKYLFNKKIDTANFTVVMGDTNSNLQYVKTVSPLVRKVSDALGQQLNRLIPDLNAIGDKGFDANLKSFYAQQATTFDTVLNSAMVMSVPKPFLDAHTELVSLARQMRSIDQAVAGGDTDVVKATLALQALGDTPDKYISFLTLFTDAIKSENVDVDSL